MNDPVNKSVWSIRLACCAVAVDLLGVAFVVFCIWMARYYANLAHQCTTDGGCINGDAVFINAIAIMSLVIGLVAIVVVVWFTRSLVKVVRHGTRVK